MAADQEKTRRLGAYLASIDESGFLLIPTVRRTWAPRAKTPLLSHSYRRDRISTIRGIHLTQLPSSMAAMGFRELGERARANQDCLLQKKIE